VETGFENLREYIVTLEDNIMQNHFDFGQRACSCLIISFFLLIIPAILHAATAPELIQQGDSLFEANNYPGSIACFQKATQIDSANFSAFWKLGKSLNILGEMAPRDSQLTIFEKARDAEMAALNLNDASADAHFQLARAVGKIALFKGIFNSVGLAKQVKREADKALALDSLHDGAWHILGRWNREVGKKPKFFRIPLGLGDANQKDAIDYMEKAIAINPNFIHHHLEMGITYQEYDRLADARSEFEKCLSLPVQRPFDNIYKAEAKKYLAGMDKK
jgi:tetratricopeptide (TPR) repeat protein